MAKPNVNTKTTANTPAYQAWNVTRKGEMNNSGEIVGPHATIADDVEKYDLYCCDNCRANYDSSCANPAGACKLAGD